ncbi:hypothetical protein RKD49_005420 [Streptomyces glaucescens]|jgi:hypothetical protein
MTLVAEQPTRRRFISRYAPAQLPSGSGWGIYDRGMQAFCALPLAETAHPPLVPLEWPDRMGAEVWLYLCRVAWGAALIEAPDGWNGH